MSGALILYLLLGLALLGIFSSTVFLGLAVAGAIRFHRDARRARCSQPARASLPPVSVLKPVHGAEAQLKENLESFFRQDYPSYEILIAADQADDVALDVAREVSARYPHIPCRILVTGVPPWPNPPAYCFYRMT